MLKSNMKRNTLRGGANSATVLAVGTLVAGALLVLLLFKDQRTPSTATQDQDLILFCAAGVRLPVEAIARDYEKAYGTRIQLNYGGSQTLLSGLKVSRQGDLYLPADDTYVTAARQDGLASEAISVATMRAVLCVPKGNPKGIRSLQDLLRENITVAQANPDAAAIGKLTRKVLANRDQWRALEAHTKVFKGTVNEVANDVKLGAVDVGIAWDAVVAQYAELESVQLPELAEAKADITIAVLESAKNPTAALRFARFLSARDRGLLEFAKHGYQVARGDVWEEHPTLNLYSGAMLRPAIEQTIRRFEEREGVRISTKFNGCGILVAAMKTGEHPDAYFSCETSFMDQVSDLFLQPEDISQNQLVILVAKDNPHGIKTLTDLAKPDLRLGLGHEKQSALGALTRNALLATGAYDAVRKNLAVESPTGDFLVNQIRTGSLDAVVVYLSNAMASKDVLDIVPVESEGALAIQPVAVGRDSNHQQLAARFIEAIKSAESQEQFLTMGFTWQWKPPHTVNQ